MAVISDQPPPVATDRRPVWDIVIDHIMQRRPALGRATVHDAVIDRVIADMHDRDVVDRTRYGVPLTSGNGRNHLVDAYQEALDLAAYLATELDEHGISPDSAISTNLSNCTYLFRVQAMLWNHVRTIVQLRALIEERGT